LATSHAIPSGSDPIMIYFSINMLSIQDRFDLDRLFYKHRST